MEDTVTISTDLTRLEAGVLLDMLRSEYAAEFQTHWYEERFSGIAITERHNSVVAAFPTMAAKRRLIVALSQSLGRRVHR